MNINLEKLYLLQKELDLEIAKKHHITYETTSNKRLLALLVELGEFSNETRCFKYWSNKGPSEKEVVLDEYVDGLHFFLSLGIPLGTKKYVYEISRPNRTLSDQIIEVYNLISKFSVNRDLDNYTKAFGEYLNIISLLDVTSDEIIEAYLKKLEVNHKRQENNY